MLEAAQTHPSMMEEKGANATTRSGIVDTRHSSLYDQARSPAEVISSIRNDFTWSLARDAILSTLWLIFGVWGSGKLILPLMGGMTIRPIPYQVTAAGDVLLDLALANDLTDETFSGELSFSVIPVIFHAVPHSKYPMLVLMKCVPNHPISRRNTEFHLRLDSLNNDVPRFIVSPQCTLATQQ